MKNYIIREVVYKNGEKIFQVCCPTTGVYGYYLPSSSYNTLHEAQKALIKLRGDEIANVIIHKNEGM